jgi:hypothetical protein
MIMFLVAVQRHIAQLKPILQANADVILAVEGMCSLAVNESNPATHVNFICVYTGSPDAAGFIGIWWVSCLHALVPAIC